MGRLQTVLIILLVGYVAGACGVVPRSPQPPGQFAGESSDAPSFEDSASATTEPEQQPSPTKAVSSLNEAKVSLMQAYREWEGTPYILGGSSKEGVDCSRFVNIVFDEYFAIDLPTNTREQLNAGDGIRRAAVRTGDLVFFKTGRRDLHVGIAVNQGEFMHASTSNGVMISKLGNSYWRTRFLAARRVF